MYYVLDDKGNRKEGLTKEEILAILQQAIDDGSLAGIDKDSAFVSKLKCCVGGETYQMAFVTQAKYNELFTKNQLTANTFYFITDDPTEENIEANIETLAKEIDATNEDIEKIVEGKVPINATKINNLEIKQDENGVLKFGDIIIPQKKLFASINITNISTGTYIYKNSSESLLNRTFEIVYQVVRTPTSGDAGIIEARTKPFKYNASTSNFWFSEILNLRGSATGDGNSVELSFYVDQDEIYLSSLIVPGVAYTVNIISIYEIIE